MMMPGRGFCGRIILKSFLRHISGMNSRVYSNRHIRNIGLLAHIDAGKTTTTERMLFYSGKTHALGEVHRGNTVTDYLSQERERGITICSSAVAFQWKDHRINLLDTPGHIDFTMEVEQSLNAVDAVIIILDGSAGVEAQTMTVWSQSEKYELPKIVFVNKMDRPDADFKYCVEDLKSKIGVTPVCLQYVFNDANEKLVIANLYDIITLEQISWDDTTLGQKIIRQKVQKGSILDKLLTLRRDLIDTIAVHDDSLAEVLIATEDFDSVSNEQIYKALRRCTAERTVIPVLLGSAYRNVGIQTLMDAFIQYLPAPFERNQIYDCFGDEFCGKVFKIVHDKQHGPLTLVRVMRGELKKGMKLISTKGHTEVVSKVFEPLADEYREVNTVKDGNVAVCCGLKTTVTGDLLVTSLKTISNAQRKLKQIRSGEGTERKQGITTERLPETFSLHPEIPEAVYFCSVEPPSLSMQSAMEQALKQLQREDPSLRLTFNEVTGQTVLGGMGELHVDIIKSRILTEYKIEVELGPLQIAYKETIKESALDSIVLEKDIAGAKQSVSITLELLRNQKRLFSFDKSQNNAADLALLHPRFMKLIERGALSALQRGPRVGGRVVDTQVKLHKAYVGRGTGDSFVASAAAHCVQKILKIHGTRLLEPIMELKIVVPSEFMSPVMSDLSKRRVEINQVIVRSGRNKMVIARAPLAELSGYSSVLRRITSGTAHFTMQPCGFSYMNAADEEVAVRHFAGWQ